MCEGASLIKHQATVGSARSPSSAALDGSLLNTADIYRQFEERGIFVSKLLLLNGGFILRVSLFLLSSGGGKWSFALVRI